jgi:dTMP kinase
LFIVFEGIDGAGKTTQARSLTRRLTRLEHQVIMVHEPGGTPLGEAVRRWVKTRRGLNSQTELFLFSAARAQLVTDVIRPALSNGAVVIADRFVASTVAYQGYGRGMDLGLISQVNREAAAEISPDLTILLDVAPEVGPRRKTGRSNPKSKAETDNFDAAPTEFHRRVRHGYLEQARIDPARWLVLDATSSKAQVSKEIWAKVKPLL